ncbi:MFS transporter [Georgenia sp. AZ-5]|uniref:MFS transporter n=1 Tax=Georgenia sp. AZ-5 TaxID=3367526 RepID=UPI00375406AF
MDARAVALVTSTSLLASSMVVPVLVGVLAVEMQGELGFGDKGLGVAVSVFWAATSALAPLGGRLADHHGWRPAAVCGVMLVAAATVGIATLATSLAHIVAWLVVAAAGYAICSPTSNLVLLRHTPRAQSARLFGVKQSAPPLVSMLAGVSVPVVALTVGWRWAFLLGLFALPLVLWGVRRPDAALPALGAAKNRCVPPETGRAGRSASPIWPLVLAAGLGTLAMSCLTTFGVRTLVEAELSTGAAGLVFAVASALALVLRLAAGWYLDGRVEGDLRPVLGIMLGAVTGLLLVASGSTQLVVAGVVLGIVAAWGWPPLLLLAVLQARADAPARTSGSLQVGSGLGSALGPSLFGVLTGYGGFVAAWAGLALATAVAAVLVWTAHGRLRGT